MRQGWFYVGSVDVETIDSDVLINLPFGFAVISQTCDLSRTDRPLVQVASLVQFDEAETAKWGAGGTPRYRLVAGNFYADFDNIVTTTHSFLEKVGALTPISLDDEKAFRQSIARKFGRLALPTHVERGLTGLRNYLIAKVKNPGSAPGQMIQRISEIRVGVEPDWDEASRKEIVELTLILQTGDLADMSAAEAAAAQQDDVLTNTLATIGQKPPREALNLMADQLQLVEPASASDRLIWESIASQVRALVVTKYEVAEDGEVEDVNVTVTTKNGFNLDDYEATERLDLAHLSGDEEDTNDD